MTMFPSLTFDSLTYSLPKKIYNTPCTLSNFSPILVHAMIFAILSNIRNVSLCLLVRHSHISNKLTFLLNCFNASLISMAHILLVFNSFSSLFCFSFSWSNEGKNIIFILLLHLFTRAKSFFFSFPSNYVAITQHSECLYSSYVMNMSDL